jgi:hypothetical protein
MINFIITYALKSKNFVFGLFGIILLLFIFSFVNNYFEAKYKIQEYKRIEEETKVFHEENIQKLKTTLHNAKNAKKSDFNDTGNLDDDYLLEALE